MYLNMKVDETRTHGNQTTGNWHIFMGKARQQWGMLTNDNEDLSKGYEREMAGRFQKFYGISKQNADLASRRLTWRSNRRLIWRSQTG